MKMVALLRGINVGGNRRVPMAELRALADACFGGASETYIQSGNLVFTTKGSPAVAAAALEKAIERRFGFFVDVLVRTEKQWAAYLAQTELAREARERPKQVHLCLCKRPPAQGAGAAILARATLGEQLVTLGDALLVDFRGGVGASKLTPAVLDRAVGSCVTARNWVTVQALGALMAASP